MGQQTYRVMKWMSTQRVGRANARLREPTFGFLPWAPNSRWILPPWDTALLA